MNTEHKTKIVIAELYLECRELRNQNVELKKTMRRIRMECVGVGGPLNDNKLGFDEQQRKVFHRIESLTSMGDEADDDEG